MCSSEAHWKLYRNDAVFPCGRACLKCCYFRLPIKEPTSSVLEACGPKFRRIRRYPVSLSGQSFFSFLRALAVLTSVDSRRFLKLRGCPFSSSLTFLPTRRLLGQHTLTPEPVAGFRPLIPRLAADQATPLYCVRFLRERFGLIRVLLIGFRQFSAPWSASPSPSGFYRFLCKNLWWFWVWYSWYLFSQIFMISLRS